MPTIFHNSRGSDRFSPKLLGSFVIASLLLLGNPLHARASDTLPAEQAADAAQACPSIIPVSRKNDATYLSLKGVKCFEAQEFSRAYALYSRALELEPNATLYGAIGRVLHELGLYTLAASYYREYLDLSSSSDSTGTQLIQNRLRQLEEQLATQAGTIRVTSEPSQATVYLILPDQDWLELGPTPVQFAARTGRHKIVVVHDGFYRQHHTVNLNRNGKTAHVTAELVPEDAVFDITARQWRKAGTWTMISGSPVLLTGVTLLLVGTQDLATANSYSLGETGHTPAEKRTLINRGNSLRTWGIATASVGTAAIITGAILYINGNAPPAANAPSTRQNAQQQPAARLTPFWGVNQIGVQLSW